MRCDTPFILLSMEEPKRGLSPQQKMLKKLFLGKAPSAYFPQLVTIFGFQLGLLLSQLAYWEGKQSDSKGGSIYKTEQDLKKETGLTAANQKHAIKLGVRLGVLEMSYHRIPRRRHYRVLWIKVAKIIEFEAPKHGLNVSILTMQMGENHPPTTELTQQPTSKSLESKNSVGGIMKNQYGRFFNRKAKNEQE